MQQRPSIRMHWISLRSRISWLQISIAISIGQTNADGLEQCNKTSGDIDESNQQKQALIEITSGPRKDIRSKIDTTQHLLPDYSSMEQSSWE
jgi:hypothetical protein